MMKKQQQWTLLFKVFFSKTTLNPPLINSSSSSSPSYIARPFCSLATTTNKQQQQLLEKKLPLLIVPYNHIGSDGSSNKKEKKLANTVWDDTLGFISLFHGNNDDVININNKAEVYKLYLPEIADRRICGSSEGWLVTVHENGEIQLLNPFSKVLVHLPPLTTFPEVFAKFISEEKIAAVTCVHEDKRGLCYIVDEYRTRVPSRSVYDFSSSPTSSQCYAIHGSSPFREAFLSKVVTNTTTTDANSTTTTTSVVVPTVVMAIYGRSRKLAFCRPSTGINGTDDEQNNKWISCLEGDRGGWEDVTFYKGNFYAVSHCYGHVSVVKGLDGPSPFVESIIQQSELEPSCYTDMKYLVESSSSSSSGGGGDLLLVMRNIKFKMDVENDEEDRPHRTIGFRVFKLDFNRHRPGWVEVTNLGEDCALFIGYNHSFSLSASKFPGCRGNCVYFTDNHHSMIYYFPRGGRDIGVYNLEDGSIEKLNYETTSSSQSFMSPPIWYVPN